MPETTSKPVILAFHGSGSNAMIHGIQLARLVRHLKSTFNVVPLEAPYPSAAGPGVLPFFEGCGPYKLWVHPSEQVSIDGMKSGSASSKMSEATEDIIKKAVADAKSEGSKVVGVLGFSQGTRVVAGLLKSVQIKRAIEKKGGSTEGLEWLDFKFGISVCGSYPPPLVPESVSKALEASGLDEAEKKEVNGAKIQTPTIHISGNQDEWQWTGKMLIEQCYEEGEGKSDVKYFDMGHHYPSDPAQTEGIVDWVAKTWKEVN
ncbi:citrinin biosynthesis oxidoreductase-like protein CtnB [Corynespora cassiicola Philippines]|uniref:Citrinin biosynthesis oxidoreductase-like protein CtnB n=1 Tax=Corynespora cassiicola Philippines TaxID=1448308 RepID=A0A2T2NRE1_CORCC|nr:citrinin biosynthesis oxidoreductase-like protein CtnB [Corynespora cassiicola Philippines]